MVVTLFPLASPTRSAILAWQFVHLHMRRIACTETFD